MQLKNKKKNLEAINKQEKQLKKSRIKRKRKKLIKRVEKEEKSGRIMLLRDSLNDILLDYCEMNITGKGKDIVEKLTNDERMNYDNLLFKAGCAIVGNYDFYKRFGTLHDLFYDLTSEAISIKKAVKEQTEMIKKIERLKNLVLSEANTSGAIKKTRTLSQEKKTLTTQKIVLNNALKIYEKLL